MFPRVSNAMNYIVNYCIKLFLCGLKAVIAGCGPCLVCVNLLLYLYELFSVSGDGQWSKSPVVFLY